jgi:CHASE3 domain sensor protein
VLWYEYDVNEWERVNVLFRNLSTRQLVLIGLIVPLICTMLISWLQWQTINGISKGRSIGRQIRSVQVALGVFRYSLSDAESGQFRYVLTHTPGDLNLCRSLMAKANEQFALLRQLTAGNDYQQKVLDQIEPLLKTKTAVTENSLQLEQSGNHAAALQIISSDDSRQNMLQIEGAVENLQLISEQQVFIRQSVSSHSLKVSGALSVAGLGVNLACIFAILLLIRRLHALQSTVTLDALKEKLSYDSGKLSIEEYLRRRAEALSVHGKAQIEAEKLLSQLGSRQPGRATERVPTVEKPPG